MTAIIYFGEILVASLLAIALLAISQLRMGFDAVLFASGVVALTLAEYLVHRFVLHGFAPIEHRRHHANPGDAVLTIFWQIWICFALVYLIAGGASLRARWLPMPGICSCITALITVQTVCRCHFLSIIEAITDLRPETTASAPHFGTMSSGRCCADDVGTIASVLVIQMEMSSAKRSMAEDQTVQKRKFPVIGFVKDPSGIAALYIGKREGKDLTYLGKVGGLVPGRFRAKSGSSSTPW